MSNFENWLGFILYNVVLSLVLFSPYIVDFINKKKENVDKI